MKPLVNSRDLVPGAVPTAEVESDCHDWFRAANKGIPAARFDDVTLVIEVDDDTSVESIEVEVVEEVLPPIIPQPSQRTSTPLPAGTHRDERFADLAAILRELRVILADDYGMRETSLDAVEWRLRTKIASLP